MIAGKPLIAWTIEAALKSHYIDRIVISSDDWGTLRLASSYRVWILQRPDRLCADDSMSESAAIHALQYADDELVTLLQPTSPLRSVDDIDGTIQVLAHSHRTTCATTCGTRINGAVYVAASHHLRGGGKFVDRQTLHYEMPFSRSLDIDTEDDLVQADHQLRERACASSASTPD